MVLLFFVILLIIIFIKIIITDFKSRIISDKSLILLFLIGAGYKFLKYGYINLVASIIFSVFIFFLCFSIGYFYYKKKNIEIAGGGDYKLIAILGVLFGIKDLFICLLLEFIYELIYRYILYPSKKKEGLPLGTSLGIISIFILIIGEIQAWVN